MSKLRYVTRNPLLLVLPLVAALLFGWYHFVEASPPLNSSRTNILPNAGLDDIDDNGMPIGWQFISNRPGASAKSEAGYSSPKLLTLSNQSATNQGSATITSPLAAVKSQETYLYKGFYKSSVPFDLIMRTSNKDGSQTQAVVGQYSPNDQWTTDSYVFTGGTQAQTVQFIYSIDRKGVLQIDDNYLEPHPQDVYQPPNPRLGSNIVSGDGPTSTGWQTTAAPLQGNQRLQASFSYRSDKPVEVDADYTVAAGKQRFSTITTLPPVTDWTSYTASLEAPPDTTNAAVLLNTPKSTSIEAKSFSLNPIPFSSGAHTWRRPLISYTFDDGWQSSYKIAAPLLEQNGFRATYYVNPATLDTSNFMSSQDVGELRSHGHELGSHSYTHQDLTTLTSSSIDYQLQHAYQYFTEVQNEQSVDFATPYGDNDAQVTYYARKYYASLRGTLSGINTKQNLDAYNLLAFYVQNDTQPSQLADALAETKARNGWLILVYHRVEKGKKGDATITPEQFEQELALVKGSGITVEPVTTALREVNYQ